MTTLSNSATGSQRRLGRDRCLLPRHRAYAYLHGVSFGDFWGSEEGAAKWQLAGVPHCSSEQHLEEAVCCGGYGNYAR